VRGGDAAPRPLERDWYRDLESPDESRPHFRAGVSIIERAPLMPGAASAVDSAQDLGELRSQHGHFSPLAADLAGMVHHPTANLDQLLAQRGRRPARHLLGHGQCG